MSGKVHSNTGGCLARIRTLYPQLTQGEQRVADYVLNNEDIIYRSITEVVALSKAGYGSVTRFCKKLGLAGFQDLKIHLAKDLALKEANTTAKTSNDIISRTADDSINEIQNTLQLLSRKELEGAAGVLCKANMVLVAGCGGSAVTAKEVEYRLTRFGIRAVAVFDTHMQSIRAATLGPKDVVFLVSFTGSTKAVLAVARAARKAGAKIVCLTNFAQSPVAELSHFKLVTAVKVNPLQAEVVSKVANDFVIEVLFRRILALRKESTALLEKTFAAVSDKLL